MATSSSWNSSRAPFALSVLREDWLFCAGAVDTIIKTLEKVPSEALQDPLIDEQLNTLAATMKRVTKLSEDVIAMLPVATNSRSADIKSSAEMRRSNRKTKDDDLIKFDDGDSRPAVAGSNDFDLPNFATSTVNEFVANFLRSSPCPEVSPALPNPEVEQQHGEHDEAGALEITDDSLTQLASPVEINHQRFSSTSSDVTDVRLVNRVFQGWEFAGPRTYKYLSFNETIDKKVLVNVGFVESPAIFFVCPDTNSFAYEALEEQLQIFGEILASEKITLQSPRIDEPCIARYAVDGLYYRAVVKSLGNSDCHIHYVDFGNSAFIPNDELHPLPVDLLEPPCAVLKCSLNHVDTRDLTTDVVADFLKRLREGDTVFVEPSRLTNPSAPPGERLWRVQLFNRDNTEIGWQKQKRPQEPEVAINLLPLDDGTEDVGRSSQACGRQTPSAQSAETAAVGDLLGMGGFTPEVTAEEELKRALALSVVEF